MNVELIVALTAIVSSIAVAVSTSLVFLQLRRLRLSQDISVVLELYNRSTKPEMLNASEWVKTQMPEKFSYEDFVCHRDARLKLQQLWYHFEFIGVLVNKGYVSEDLIFDQQGSFIAEIWDKTKNFIEARREDKNWPRYMENFEILRNRYAKWTTVHQPKLVRYRKF